jgi:hypothetical protein
LDLVHRRYTPHPCPNACETLLGHDYPKVNWNGIEIVSLFWIIT